MVSDLFCQKAEALRSGFLSQVCPSRRGPLRQSHQTDSQCQGSTDSRGPHSYEQEGYRPSFHDPFSLFGFLANSRNSSKGLEFLNLHSVTYSLIKLGVVRPHLQASTSRMLGKSCY